MTPSNLNPRRTAASMPRVAYRVRHVMGPPRGTATTVLSLSATVRDLRAMLSRISAPSRPEVAIARQLAPFAARLNCLALRVGMVGGRR